MTTDFSSAYARIQSATGCRTQVDLCTLLDISQSSVSDAKSRNAIPASWLLCLLHRHQLNPDWILSGQGSRYLVPSDDVE